MQTRGRTLWEDGDADGGEPTEMSSGDVAVFPNGWSGTWDIHETLRKVYAIF